MKHRLLFAAWAVISIFILQGCVTLGYSEHAKRVWCRHESILAAVTMGEESDGKPGYPVRLCSGVAERTGGDGVPGFGVKYHMQAEAFIDGRWQPIHEFNGVVDIARKDAYFPTRCIYLGNAYHSNDFLKGESQLFGDTCWGCGE